MAIVDPNLIGIGGAGGSFSSGYTLDVSSAATTAWVTSRKSNIEISADGDLKLGDVSMRKWMETVEKRLCILEPKRELLDKYEALQAAYEHYKTLEAMLYNESK